MKYEIDVSERRPMDQISAEFLKNRKLIKKWTLNSKTKINVITGKQW